MPLAALMRYCRCMPASRAAAAQETIWSFTNAAAASVGPPAGNPRTKRTGRVGNCSACAAQPSARTTSAVQVQAILTMLPSQSRTFGSAIHAEAADFFLVQSYAQPRRVGHANGAAV